MSIKFPKKTQPRPLSPKEFYERRNKILVIRKSEGLGDILMHRMMFEDFKRVMPDSHLIFACLEKYRDAAANHPFVDEVVSVETLDPSQYVISYSTGTACIRHEMSNGINVIKHRADIWAEHCGVTLTKHNMHLPSLDPDLLARAKASLEGARLLSKNKDGPAVLFTPLATDLLRCLPDHLMVETVHYLRSLGCLVYNTHTNPIPILNHLRVPTYQGNVLEWMSFIQVADYVLTVDTSVFHYAGGIDKPMTGIFTYADGKVRGKYFDFILVQKHKDNGNWPCGPCYNFMNCTNPRNQTGGEPAPKPCLTELTFDEVKDGIDKMFKRWSVKKANKSLNTTYATAYTPELS
jgi:ADP-heptose:LPS heptosyltransferase